MCGRGWGECGGCSVLLVVGYREGVVEEEGEEERVLQSRRPHDNIFFVPTPNRQN